MIYLTKVFLKQEREAMNCVSGVSNANEEMLVSLFSNMDLCEAQRNKIKDSWPVDHEKSVLNRCLEKAEVIIGIRILQQHYGTEDREVALAIGWPLELFAAIQEGRAFCSAPQKAMLESAVKIAEKPLDVKRRELTILYEKVRDHIKAYLAVEGRRADSASSALLDVRIVLRNIVVLRDILIEKMYWRSQKLEREGLTESHLQYRTLASPKVRSAAVAEKIVFNRLRSALELGILQGFSVGGREYTKGYFMSAIDYSSSSRGYIFITRQMGHAISPEAISMQEDHAHPALWFKLTPQKQPNALEIFGLSHPDALSPSPHPIGKMELQGSDASGCFTSCVINNILFLQLNYENAFDKKKSCSPHCNYIAIDNSGSITLEGALRMRIKIPRISLTGEGEECLEDVQDLSSIEHFFEIRSLAEDITLFLNAFLPSLEGVETCSFPDNIKMELIDDDEEDLNQRLFQTHTGDAFVGTIELQTPIGCSPEREQRDIFSSNECKELYYLTRTGNRVFVLDKKRICFSVP